MEKSQSERILSLDNNSFLKMENVRMIAFQFPEFVTLHSTRKKGSEKEKSWKNKY
jgi:hypothetical protein